MHLVHSIRRKSVVAVLFKTTVAELTFQAAILCKTTVSMHTRCGSQASCSLDRSTPAFCCDPPTLKMIVVYSARMAKGLHTVLLLRFASTTAA